MHEKEEEGGRIKRMRHRRNIVVTPTSRSGNTVPVFSETVTCWLSMAGQHAGEEHTGLVPEDQHANQPFC